VAVAGVPQFISVGEPVMIDGSASYDRDGDALIYQWDIIYQPLNSLAILTQPNAIRFKQVFDVQGVYVLQLTVVDAAGSISYDVVTVSTINDEVIARIGDAALGTDTAILNQVAALDGRNSSLASTQLSALGFQWSLLGLAGVDGEVLTPNEGQTQIDFSTDNDALITDSDAIAGLALLSEYNLVSFGNLNSNVDTRGRTLVGGNLVGGSATFATGVNGANGTSVLEVVGNINGGPKNINNGGNVVIGGTLRARLNLNGGGEVINDPNLSVTTQQFQLNRLSDILRDIEANSLVELPGQQPGPARLLAEPDAQGVAVFNIANGNQLFRNNRVQQIELIENDADAIIVNVGGNNVNFNRGNFVGALNSDRLTGKIIWNFHEATQVKIFRGFSGTILAPHAFVHTRSQVKGTVIADRVLERGPVGLPGFVGEGLSDGETEAVRYALVQLGVRDTFRPDLPVSYDTSVLTVGNLRPVGHIERTGGLDPLERGTEITFSAGSSFDGNNDPLFYQWSLIHSPEGSESLLSESTSVAPSLTPDQFGDYVVQLTLSDGRLLSDPVTHIFTVENNRPLANAGDDQTVARLDRVVLDGSRSSDPEGDELSYQWAFVSRPDGSGATFTDGSLVSPSFIADRRGNYVVSLVVDDGFEESDVSEVKITVPNLAPLAVISRANDGFVGDMITLSGAQSSDPDGDALTYNWALTVPSGSTSALVQPDSVAPMFTPDIGGTYIVSLSVSDGDVTSPSVSLTLNITEANRPPVLSAINDQVVPLGSLMDFTISADDPDGDALTFFVNPLPLPIGASFDAASGQFSFAPAAADPQNVTLTFGVSDGELSDSQSATFTITTDPDNVSTSYTGRVIDAETGEPLAGVLVKVEDQTVETSSDGTFIVTGLEPGNALICIEPGTISAGAFGSLEYTVNLIEGVINQQGDVAVAPVLAAEEIIEDEDIVLASEQGDVQFEIPAGTLLMASDEARFWRIFFNSSAQPDHPNGVVALSELSFVSRAGEENLLSNVRNISQSSAFSSRFTAVEVIDGNTTTLWSGTILGGSGEWIAYDFGQENAVSVNAVTITSRLDQFGPIQAPRDFEIQSSDDGENWITRRTVLGEENWQSGEARSFSIGSQAQGQISLVELTQTPEQFLPIGQTCRYYGLDSKAAILSATGRLTVPNLDNLLPGTPIDIWISQSGMFAQRGSIEVGSDSSRIMVDVEGLRGGEYIALLPQPLKATLGPDMDRGIQTPNSLADGNVANVISMPPVSTIFGPHPIDLIYNSQSADPQIILSADIEIPASATIPQRISLSGNVAGLNLGEVFVSTSEPEALDEAIDEVIRQAIASQASNLETGSYPFELDVTSYYDCSQVVRKVAGRVNHINERESAFGAGWTLAELDRIELQDDGTALLVSGTGQSRTFTQSVRPTSVPPATGLRLEMFDTPNSVAAVATGFEGLERGTFTVRQAGEDDLALDEWPINIVNFPDTSFDRSAFYNVGLNNRIDEGSSVTDPQGDDFAIFPPGGNDSFGARISGFLYIPEGGDIEFQLVIDDTFDLILGGRSLTRFISQTDSRRFTATLDNVPPGFIPIIVNFSENRGEANLTLEISGGGLPGGFDSSENFYLEIPNVNGFEYESPDGDFSTLVQNEDGTFTRRLKNGTIYQFNADGLMTSVADTNGNTRRYDYDTDGRLIRITDPGSLETQFNYGSDGRIDRITDAAGRTSNFNHDANGNLARFENTDDTVQTFRYDSTGKVLARTDEDGFETEFEYGEAGQIAMVTVPDGEQINTEIGNRLGLANLGPSSEPVRFTRPDERITEYADARGNESLMQYNEFDAVIFMRDAIGRETRYERNEDNLATVIIAPSDVTADGTLRTELTYDALGNVIEMREAVGTNLERVMTYEYEPVFSQLTRMVDYDGFETIYTYDDKANLLSITDPLGGVQEFTYDGRGLRLTQTDENGNLTSMSYDAIGRVTAMVDPSNTRTEYIYDDAGNLILTREAIGTDDARITSALFDDRGRMTNSFAGDGGETLYSYDGRSNTTSVTDPTGVVETREYDSRDRLSVVNDPVTGSSTFGYDPDSNLISQTDAIGAVTTFDYDAVNRMTRSVDGEGFVRAFDYDVRDNRTGVTDGRGNSTAFAYDALDRAITRTNPLAETWAFAYDLRDNRVTSTKPDGVTLTTSYDGLSRMTQLTSSAPPSGIGAVTRNYSYDAYDNLISANDNLDGAAGVTLDFSYDQENRLDMATTSNLLGAGAVNNIHSISYDALDRRAAMTDSFGGTTRYGYDPVDRLTRVTTPQGDNFDVSYDLAGRTLSRSAPNVSNITRRYEPLTGRLSRYIQTVNGTAFNDFTYSYTPRGNIAAIIEAGEINRTRNYSYDAIERLTTLTVPEAPAQNEAYTLDEEGNRLTSQRSSSHITNEANRLLEDDDYTYVYDLNGNLTQKLGKAGTGNPDWTYRYTALDELLIVERDGEVVEAYHYDAFGRRSRIETANDNAPPRVVGIVNDGADRSIDIAVNDNAATGSTNILPLRRYTHSANVDEPLQLEVFDDTGSFEARYTYHADHLGSIRFLTDAAGNIASAYDYDSYGNILVQLESVEQPFLYTGREYDPATELHHYRARYYDANMGRFIQEDPIGFNGEDNNLYRYVRSNPVNFNDPTGLTASGEFTGASAQALGTIGSISNVGVGLNCLFQSLAASVEYEHNFTTGREAQAGQCYNSLKSDTLKTALLAASGFIIDNTPLQNNYDELILFIVGNEVSPILGPVLCTPDLGICLSLRGLFDKLGE